MKVEFYSSIKDMPASRYTEFQKMLAYDANVGSTFEDALSHIKRLLNFLSADKMDEMKTEAINLHNNYYFLLEGYNFRSMSFACMVKTIDGVSVEIADEESIKTLSERLGEMYSQAEVEIKSDGLKKKLMLNLISTFQRVSVLTRQEIMQKM